MRRVGGGGGVPVQFALGRVGLVQLDASENLLINIILGEYAY